MVGEKTITRRRLIEITSGNVRNHHLYITGHHDFFPIECYGEASSAEGTGRMLTLIVDGLGAAVETDIAKSRGKTRPRNFFRKRAWVGRFFERHGLKEGDVIALDRLDSFTYRVHPFRQKEAAAGPAKTKARKHAAQKATLLPDAQEAMAKKPRSAFGDTAFIGNRAEPLHRWVPWIAGFSASFVQKVLDREVGPTPADVTVLDPFAGVGTTLVEAIKKGCNAVGFEINPYAALACDVKVGCLRHRLQSLNDAVTKLETLARKAARKKVNAKSAPPCEFRTRVPFFSPAVEHQVLLIQDFIGEQNDEFIQKVLKLVLGAVMVSFSNYSYEPSLSTRSAAGKGPVNHADVFGVFRSKLAEVEADMGLFQQHVRQFRKKPRAKIHHCSYLTGANVLSPHTIDVLITSPPYLNNYHYVRNTRPQLHWLGLTDGNGDLKKLEERSFGRFWQTVRGRPAIELSFDLPELQAVLDEIRGRNPEKGVYGGGGWANYAAVYFNDCNTFFEVTRRAMKPDGLVVVVIGNNIVQGVHVETDRLLARIAERHGFRVEEMHRVRTKRTGSSIVNSSVRAGVTKKPVELYETAVELRAAK